MPQINSTDEVTDALSQFLNILEPVDLREYDDKLISLFITSKEAFLEVLTKLSLNLYFLFTDSHHIHRAIA